MSISRIRLRGELRSDGDYPDEFAIARRLSGTVTLDYGPHGVDTSRPYLRPRGDSSIGFTDASVELISFEPTVLRNLAARHLEGTGRRLRAPEPGWESSSVENARLWNAAADLVTADDGTSPLRTSVLQDLLVSTLLVTFPVLDDGRRPPPDTDVPSRAVRRAIAFIDDNLADPITVARIAEAAHITVRGLQYGFHRHLGISPTAYIRKARARAIHAELRDADPDSTTVTAVARRWGVGHTGRFAADYRTRFGELPSDTLRG